MWDRSCNLGFLSARWSSLAARRASVEDEFWKSLREIADARRETLTQLVNAIDADRNHANLSSAIRLFVLGFYRDQIAEGSALEKLGPPERRAVT
jgi:predicted DNA-binding ribbon-helix-helix protein